MGIVTKRGDYGLTSLCYGPVVHKDHAKIEASGAIDELCAYMGTVKSLVRNKAAKTLIESIQRDLLSMCAEIAADPRRVHKLKGRISARDVGRIDRVIEELYGHDLFKKARGFCLPGENFVSSVLDIARAVARRAERRVVTLKKRRMLKNVHITAYLNRLSDLLYLMVRLHEQGHCKL